MEKNGTSESGMNETKGSLVCPNCGSGDVQTCPEQYCFPYGVGEAQVELSTEVPLRTCGGCGFEFLDHVGQSTCHEAVCRHLGIMTPHQITSLRRLHTLTQAELSKITKLGEATLSRWERGVVIQNEAYDNYLYLLGFPENLKRIHNRAESGELAQLTGADAQGSELCPNRVLRRVPNGFPTFGGGETTT